MIGETLRFGIGARVPRSEDRRLLTGAGCYGDDLDLPGQLHAIFVTSPEPAGRITDVDIDTALAMPGVRGVYTCADLDSDGLGNLPCLVTRMAPLTRPDGSQAHVPPRPALVRDRVQFVGDLVAMVVADTVTQARDAAEAVSIDIDAASFVLDPVAAAAVDAPCLHTGIPDNICFAFQTGDTAAARKALSGSTHRVTVDLLFPRVAMSPMEPRTALGHFDRREGRFVLHCGTQNPHILRRALAADVFGMPETDIRIVTPDMGGAFGMRSNLFPEIVLVLWAARRLGQPVKWTGTRSDAFLTDDMGRDVAMQATLGLDSEGHFTALHVTSTAALGAYLSLFGPIPTFSNLGGLAGVYRTPIIAAEVRAVFTNMPPIAPYRGAGRPEAIACIEAAIDAAARQCGFDRLDLRRRNMIGPSDLPFSTGLSYVYDSGDFPGAMAQIEARMQAGTFDTRRQAARAQGKLRGLAIVNAIEAAASALDEGAELRIEADGTATLQVGAINHGQGQETTLAQIVADRLPVAFGHVRVRFGDTDAVRYGRGSFASRTAALAGSAVLKSTESVRRRAVEIAAHLLGCRPEQIAQDGETFRAVGSNRSLTWLEIAAAAHTPASLPRGISAGLSAAETFHADDGSTYPNGCHACEVEIDIDSGVLRVLRYAVVHDVGTELNPMVVEGQIHGGVVQGLAQILGEQMIHDAESGQPLTGSFMDYMMMRAADMPFFEDWSRPHPTMKNPLGAKGAGEAGTVGALAAGLLAVQDALAPLGIDGFQMPATPVRLWQAIQDASSHE
jgi:carbon-monoxide dehydrogenase large subunit